MTRDFRQTQAIADVQTLTSLFLKWREASSNPEITEAFTAWAQTTEWIIYLENERKGFDAFVDKLLVEQQDLRKELKRLEKVEQELKAANIMLEKYF